MNNLIETEKLRKIQEIKNDYYHNNFIPLLELGQFYEKKAIPKIIKYYKYKENITVKNNDNFKYDFEINNIKYEVKTDIKAIETSNIFVEFMQNYKPSGINKTQANFYIFVIPYKTHIFILIDVLELEFLINTVQYKNIFQRYGTAGYIFELELILKNGVLI